MIYTVTFSPAIDYVVYMDELRQGNKQNNKRRILFRRQGNKCFNDSY